MSIKGKSDLISYIIVVVLAGYALKIISNLLLKTGSTIYYLKIPILVTALSILGLFFIFEGYIYWYYNSKKFKDIKDRIKNLKNNCNELNHHINELKMAYVNIKSYDYGDVSMKDESDYNFKRKEWNKNIKNEFTHNCSSTVCKNANDQPVKYLCKYFDIEISEKSLSNFENVLNNFSAAEQGKFLLKRERDSILNDIESSIPWIINQFNQKQLIRKLGFEDIDMSDLYFPRYTFQYVSAGGNSSMKCDIKLDIENLNKLISYIKNLISYKKSVAGQRALMSSDLREKIKTSVASAK